MSSTDYSVIQGEKSELSVISLLHVLWRYKIFVTVVVIMCTGFALYLALTAKLVFRAEAVVTEVPTNGMNDGGGLGGRLGGLASLAGINLGSGGASRSAAATLNSRHLAELFVQRYRLIPTIMGNASPQTLWLAANRFKTKVLSINESKEKGTTTIAVQWSDPKLAARWANDYIALANEVLRIRALEDSSRNIKYLNEQIGKTDIVGVQRVMYELIESETKSHMLANTRKEYAFAIVDPASPPEERIWPRRSLMVFTGAVLGGFIGLFLALAHNMWVQHRKPGGAAA